MDASTPRTSEPISGHMAIAGAVSSAAVIGQSLASPFLAPFVELGSAAITASVAVHAVHRVARDSKQSTYRILRPIARSAGRARNNTVAAQALDVVVRAGVRDRRAFGLGVQLLGRCVSNQVRSVVGHILTAWCPALQSAGAALVASRAAVRGATFVKSIEAEATAAARIGNRSNGQVQRIERILPVRPAKLRMEAAA